MPGLQYLHRGQSAPKRRYGAHAAANFDGKICNLRDLGFVPIHDGGVNLKRQPNSAAMLHTVHSSLPGALLTAQAVMRSGIKAVEADARPPSDRRP